MNTRQKQTLSKINKINRFNIAITDLTVGNQMSDSERAYILASSILFIQEFKKDKRLTSYAELAYFIVLKDAILSRDYRALYDISINFGFYPITKKLFTDHLIEKRKISDELLDIQLINFENENYTETLQQNSTHYGILTEIQGEIAFIAPTSFGKSSIIVDYIKVNKQTADQIAIIVPTKSLLMQTYRMIKRESLGRRIIIHDEMFNSGEKVIAILTQERCLRLMSKHNISFDLLFIDEAHNLLENDSRSILLSRLITRNKQRNRQGRIIYLSPLIEEVESLKVAAEQSIKSFKIPFNLKEPDIFEFKNDGYKYQYNRFVDEFYKLKKYDGVFNYILQNSQYKNFLYCYRPIVIEQVASDLSDNIQDVQLSSQLNKLINTLKREVHEHFYMINYIKKGVVYIHGKMPDLIKEYIESKFAELPELKYIIANKVILEGINLPIDCLFILNTNKLYGKELTNLIGRVNRLNTIFGSNSGPDALKKLFPPVHFVNTEEYNRENGNMSNKITLLRSRVFKDEVDNCTLANYDIKNTPLKQREKRMENDLTIIERERLLTKEPSNKLEKLTQYLVETGIANFYNDLDKATNTILAQIENLQSNIKGIDRFIDLINQIFIAELTDNIVDYEIVRIQHDSARDFYFNYITKVQRRALKQNIVYLVEHYKSEREKGRRLKYFGHSYGESPSPTRPTHDKTYIDLTGKSDQTLVNLSIVKLKMEDDFVSFKLNKLIIMLHDYNIITKDHFNELIYGTKDRRKIELTKLGLSISLISRLEDDGLLQMLEIDKFGNLIATDEFNVKKSTFSDLYQFEISRHIG